MEPAFPAVPLGIGSTQLQIVPDPVRIGPSTQFVDLTVRDVAVANGTATAYFRNAVYKGVAYRVYTAQFPGAPGALVRTAIPQSDPAPTLRRLAWRPRRRRWPPDSWQHLPHAWPPAASYARYASSPRPSN